MLSPSFFPSVTLVVQFEPAGMDGWMNGCKPNVLRKHLCTRTSIFSVVGNRLIPPEIHWTDTQEHSKSIFPSLESVCVSESLFLRNVSRSDVRRRNANVDMMTALPEHTHTGRELSGAKLNLDLQSTLIGGERERTTQEYFLSPAGQSNSSGAFSSSVAGRRDLSRRTERANLSYQIQSI